ncbi:MAG TPA: phenylalanine--tRNA ligase subunit alpha [Thermoplasmata archaeon]|nr:phenylalanine--tRNA ligase subunit alpha [Thermoplasmata archaeon]
MPADVLEQLSLHEKKVLLALRGGPEATPQEVRERASFRELVEVMNAASWLQAKGLLGMKERVRRSYTLARKQWATKNLPERTLLKALAKFRRPVPTAELRTKAGLSEADFSIALGWMRRKGWAVVAKEAGQTTVSIADAGREALAKKGRDEELLVTLAKGPIAEEDLDPQVLGMLKSRQALLKEKESVRRELKLTPKGSEAAERLAQAIARERKVSPDEVLKIVDKVFVEVSQITPELLQSGKWRDASYRKYDVRAFAPTATGGRRHPLSQHIDRVRRIMLAMGFAEVEGDYVQPPFWAFDALFQPQDHPARDMLDTFFLDADPLPLPDPAIVARVAEMHETGGGISTGWRYKWNPDEARRAILRPHTTAVTIRWLADHPDPPQKAFIIGRNFRRDSITWKSLPEFHQVEGVVMEEGANLAMLIGVIKEFYRRMGAEDVRVRPGYFPYTEPSLEPEIYFNGRWMEMGGAGIFRPEVTKPLGIETPVLAWGLGLERLVMAIENIPDIRQLYLSDLDWLRNARLVR